MSESTVDPTETTGEAHGWTDELCPVCHKRVGDSPPFSIFNDGSNDDPDPTAYHLGCVQIENPAHVPSFYTPETMKEVEILKATFPGRVQAPYGTGWIAWHRPENAGDPDNASDPYAGQ